MPFEIKMTADQVIEKLKALYGTEFTTAEIKAFCAMNDITYQTVTKKLQKFKVSKGKWNLKVTQKSVDNIEKSFAAPAVMPHVEKNLVPSVDNTFVKFGNFTDVKKIVQSKQFYPTFITGLSGNGKTFGVEQVCAQSGRELIRVNITIETDEDDLIGGFRLVDGNTVWHNGPVVDALEKGTVLLLDEVDLASNKILCLQSVLEGKGVFLKKIGRYVQPSPGFNVIATANTKGKGSDDGRFVGTNVLNEAFLERFAITLEQDYPTVVTETKILKAICSDDDFCKRLADWASIIRRTFAEGGIDELISTRRLVHIAKAFNIFGSKEDAIKYSINRFDDETKQAFFELYDKIDADFAPEGDKVVPLNGNDVDLG